jgi:hypothetical protein
VAPQAHWRRSARCSATARCTRRQVEYLAGLDPDYRRVGQVRAAPAAPVGHMLDHLVGLGDLGQMGAGGAGLPAGPAALALLGGAPLGPGGLAQPIGGRRFGGVGGVLAEPTLQLSDAGLQRRVGRYQAGVGRLQLGDDCGLDHHGGFQIGIGGQDAASRTPRRQARLPMGHAAPLHQQPSHGQTATDTLVGNQGDTHAVTAWILAQDRQRCHGREQRRTTTPALGWRLWEKPAREITQPRGRSCK